MASHPDHPDWYEVRLHPQVHEDWAKMETGDLPPIDEFVLWIKPEPCSRCGKEPGEEIFACDIEGVTDEGLAIGKHLCGECLQQEGGE